MDFTRFAFLVFASLTVPAAAQGGFNMDMGDVSFGTPGPTYTAAAGQAGVWTEYDAAGITLPGGLPLIDLNGNAVPGGSVTATTANILVDFAFNNANTTGDDEAMMDDLYDASTSTIFINGIANGTYDVWVYAWAPDARTTFFSDITITGGALGTVTVGGLAWGGTFQTPGHYVKDTVTVTNNTIVIDVANPAPITPTSINGVQIVPVASGPVAYCTAGTSTNGCVPSIFSANQPSVSAANPCNILVSTIEGQKSAIMFYGLVQQAIPWAAGSNSVLCVKAPTQRSGGLNTGGTTNLCNGSLNFDWNAFQAANPSALGNPWVVGEKAYVQAWYRDPTAVKTTNLSNALELTYIP